MAGAAVTVLLAAGCSQATTSAPAPSGQPSQPGQSSQSEDFRVGLEAPLTGTQSELGQGMLRGAQLAANKLNSSGGILGKQVSIVPIDDAADPVTGTAAAEAAVGSIDAVVGPYNSGVGLATLPIYRDAGLVPMRLTSADNTAGLGFTLQPMTSQIAPTAGAAIGNWLKAGSVAIVYDETADYTRLAASALQSDLQGRGVAVSAFIPIAPGQAGYDDALAQAAATNPAVTYLATYYPEAAVLAKGLAAANSPSTCVADYSAFDNGFITNAGVDVAQRCDVLGVPSPSDFSGSADLVASYQQDFAAAPNVWSPYTYDSVLLLADAITRADSAEAAALAPALAATNGWSGWTGPVTLETPSGNRVPSQVAVLKVGADGSYTINEAWAQTSGFKF
ncbi:MAG: branched-chain amino acid ABC transporter substrate-binding protein [Candidatus Nanopelagicales bacterium]